MSPVISTRVASRWYERRGIPSVHAVDGVTLDVEPGQFVAIEGPSGSGKSTLLGLLAGIDLATNGSVIVLGHDLAHLSIAERARLRRTRMGIVFQSFGLIGSLDAEENVALPRVLEGASPSEAHAAAAGLLAEVGLEGYGPARIDELSGGERQRIGVARALISDPDLVLADEPAGSLDEASARTILDLLQRTTAARGVSLVLVTHDPSSAARADHRFHMHDGRMAAEGVAS